MKYDSQLQASDTVRMSNASTIYVQDEETTSYIRTDHENMAYVEEEDPRTDWVSKELETCAASQCRNHYFVIYR